MNQSESISALAKSLIQVQKELIPLPKDKSNPYFNSKYIGLDTLMPLALKLLNANGLALVQTPGSGMGDGASTLTTMLIHESGEFISDTQPLLLDKNNSQGQGSAITYARRYSVASMLGIVAEEDDDGNRASPPMAQRSQSPASEHESYRQAAAPSESRPAASGGGSRFPPGPKRMDSKYPGSCAECGDKIGVGDSIMFSKPEGAAKATVWHVACYEASMPEPE